MSSDKKLVKKFKLIWLVSFGLYVGNNILMEWFAGLKILRPAFLGLAIMGLGFGLAAIMLQRQIKSK